MDHLHEVSPPGWSGTVKAMKKHKEITNPWALSYWLKKKGAKPHYKPEPKKKKKKLKKFKEWIEDNDLLEAEMPRYGDFRSRTNLFSVEIGYAHGNRYEHDPEDVLDTPGIQRQTTVKQFNNLMEAARYFREIIYKIQSNWGGKEGDPNRIVHLSMTYYSEDTNRMGVPRGVTLAYWNKDNVPGRLGQVHFGPMMDKLPNMRANLQLPSEPIPAKSKELYQQWLQKQNQIATSKTNIV